MLGWLSKLFGMKSTAKRAVSARYDAAMTGPENRRHWANADALGPKSANSPEVRRTLRNRARYETANNSLAGGMVRTYAADVIGTGPRLQMLTDNDSLNQRIETEFRRWMQATGFAAKLRTMCESKTVDGECFALFVTNQKLPVPGVSLDLRLIEAEQISHGTTAIKPNEVDGIRFDEIGNPVEYLMLSEHPGESGLFSMQVSPVKADQMLHLFECPRPGTARGVPEIMPALPLWAILRRYELATLNAAEVVANMGAILLEQVDPNNEDVELAENFSEMEIARGVATSLPPGMKASQMKAEQPTSMFVGFWQQIAASAARCLSMPKNIALCDSAGYNYASGRLDHQTYYKAIDVQRGNWEIRCLDKVFAQWLREATRIRAYLPEGAKVPDLPHEWYWDGSRHVDPEKEANAQQVRLTNGMTTRAAEFAREGKDWEAEMRQLAKEQALAEELGLTFGQQPAAQTTTTTGEVVDDNGDPVTDQNGEPAMNAKGRRTARRQDQLRASSSPSPLVLASCRVEIEAAESGEGAAKGKPRKVNMVAYTGGAMTLDAAPYPVIVDLATAKTGSSQIALLKNHDHAQIAGHAAAADVEITPQRIKLSGQLSGDPAIVAGILELAGNGFQWQASVGGNPQTMEYVGPGESVKVNGRNFDGPCVVARGLSIREVSFVPIGADGNTSAIAASFQGGRDMGFEAWLKAKGFDPATITAEQKTSLKAMFEAELAAGAGKGKTSGNPPVEPPAPPAIPDPTAQIRAAAVAETNRIRDINAACKGFESLTTKLEDGKEVNIQSHAIEAGWSKTEAELHVLRASRSSGPAIHAHSDKGSEPDILEAAACQAIGLQTEILEAHYKPELLQAAHTAHKGRLSLQEMILRAAHRQGFQGFNFKANPQGALRAAWSSGDFSGILSNVANKFLLETYMAVENTWRMICATRPVSDFKQITSYRLTGNMLFEEVGNGGELKHGTLGQQSYNNQARTYGKMLALTRTDMINDDLSALAAAPRMLGRGSALKLNEVVWTAFMDNASFFAASHAVAGDTGNANYASGSDTALSIDSLTAAELLFLNQVDPNGNPLGVVPRILLVPNALNVKATSLCRDLELRDTTASTKYTTSNPHAGKFTPVRSSYLSNTGISGYSTKKWYLLADPNDVPTIEVCFLNGQETPVIEQAEADFSVLGVQMRGFFDFGAAKQDYRGGVAMKGEA